MTLRLFPILFILLVAGACTHTPEAQVTRFHTLESGTEPPGRGRAVSIEPAGSIVMGPEFVSYADMLGSRLAMHGFQPAGNGPADIIARLDYESELREGTRADGPQTSVGVGVGGGSRRGMGFGVSGIFDVTGSEQDVYEYTLSVTLDDAGTDNRLFEGRAVVAAGAGDISAVMPFLMDALFRDFPGRSGETVRVDLELPN